MEKCAVECAKKLGGVTVVVKGEHDIITNGETVVYCSEQGGLKRCGGQGDVTSGAIATFLGWSVCYRQNRWRHENEISQEEIPILAAYAGCLVTRRASHLAYNEHGFSTQTSEILKHLNNARSFLAKY
ncbi:ATP-dependent (S)-NAD(P)H-hydrate dehydratase [Zancudomyces culisetae]|uniref:ATP-dependent (S)-NAD(P)H-hydrate dehydratase n=1 Tax=Zancudomyces culisetae TaxID=1213189 RepID=A0A1R1PK27_ZANCU|nr:ATP-dependent (S)-NAD(P)H-hydrate dehydratase [Zancudomyces culisetae]|eukprot:OMH81289.1 ATP-dependent (S)-NAD(P)H-hydrate dehydratase [Zancudomyces culisetae]